MRKVKGIEDLGVFRVLGQPNDNFIVDRQAAARYQINVADVQDAIRPPSAATRSPRFCRANSATTWCCAICRSSATRRKPSRISACSPPPESASRSRSFAKSKSAMAVRKFIAKATSAMSPSSTACAAAIWAAPWKKRSRRLTRKFRLPRGYHIDWEGEYESEKRAEARLPIIVPLTVLLIFIILYTMFRSFKWALLILVNVMLAPHRRSARAADHAHQFQRILGRRHCSRSSAFPCRPA